MNTSRVSRLALSLVPVLAGAIVLTACDDGVPSEAEPPAARYAASTAPAPTPLVSATASGEARMIWPFTGTDVGAHDHASDPINLIFVGDSDPLAIRATLLSLTGSRPLYPPFPFFQCAWRDAMGNNQTAWASSDGWSGSAIQLECGDYDGLRFHLRLFRAGDWTLGNAHFETVIPGTHEHEVLNWELAEQFVTADLARAGVLVAPPDTTEPINPRPFFRTINPHVYWHPMMTPLHTVINAMVLDPQTIGIRSDGRATVLALGNTPGSTPGLTRQELVIAFDQVIPKPFCGGPTEFMYVTGPLTLRQDVTVAASGLLAREFHASGELTATPVHPITRQPLGPPARALVNGLYKGMASGELHSMSSLLTQTLLRDGRTPQRLVTDLQVGPHGLTRSRRQEQCGN
jgi:hypothetical protein